MRVVLAVADAQRRGRLHEGLVALGHEVSIHADGHSAWAACRDLTAPLVVLDWDLPGLDGPELCRRIRRLDEEVAGYVLLLAPFARPDELLGAVGDGADDVLCGEATPAELALRVRVAERRLEETTRLREEHRSYMELLAQAPDLIQTVGLDGQLLHVNRAWCDALGYAERDLPGLSFFDLVAVEQQSAVRKAFRWVVRGRGIQHLQTELRTRDGGVLSVEGSLTPRYRGRVPTSVRVILRDVSRRKRAETVLRNVLEGTSATTGKDFFRSLVRHLCRALGARQALVAELVGGPSVCLSTLAIWGGESFHGNRTFELTNLPASAVLQGEVRSGQGKETSLFPGARFLEELGAESYLGVPLTNSAGHSIGLLCVLNDGPLPAGPDALRILATFAQRAGAELERLRAQERLASSEARMRAMLDALPDLLFRVDAEGRYLDVRVHDPGLLAIPPQEIVGRTLGALLPDDVAGRWMAGIGAALASGRVELVEYELPWASGPRQFEARIVGCGPGEVLTVVRDVTEQRKAEAARRELDRRMQMSQKLESLGVLAGGIAHDFNNLLTSIMGYASLAQRSTAPGSKPHRYLGDIEKASRRAADLAMQMLAYSGKGQFVVQPLDLRSVMRETAEFLRTDVTGRRVVVRLDVPPALSAVVGDVTQMRQVIMNLVLNAAQAMEPEGGTVTLAVREEPVSESELLRCYVGSDLPAGRYVTLTVEDHGCGMDAATKARIFDPFFTTKALGRGLGLAAVVGIVRGHGGALSVHSRPGEGTRVHVHLPPSAKVPRPEEPPVHVLPVRGEGLVLVVDDEPALRQLTTDILESGGYRVETAADGLEGVETFRLRGDDIDVVLLDMTMPNMDGVEAFQAMRALRPDVRVIVSSGYTEKEAVNRFRGDAPASFIQKPYTAGELLRAISEVVPARPSHARRT